MTDSTVNGTNSVNSLNTEKVKNGGIGDKNKAVADGEGKGDTKKTDIANLSYLIMGTTANIHQQNTDVAAKSQKMPVGFMQEDNGNYSFMRLMSLIALIAAIFSGGYTLAKPDVKDVGNHLTSIFLTAAFTTKAVQKFAEEKVK